MLFSADELIEKSKDQRQRRRYEEALISAMSATESDPDNAEAWWQVALNQLSIGDSQHALPALERTVELAPHFSFGWAKYGTALLQAGDEETAQVAFESALEEDPEQEDALKALADIYYRQNKDNKEADEQELAILSVLENVAGLSDLQCNRIGILHYQKKNFFEAIKYYQQNVSSSAYGRASLFNLGLVYNQREMSQNADAVDMWRLLLKRHQGYSPAQEQIAAALPRLLMQAKSATNQGVTILPTDQWGCVYINPFQLLNSPDNLDFKDFDAKLIKRLKDALLKEIELEDGCIEWMAYIHIDRSRAIGICEELTDETKRVFHWHVYQNKLLLDFLSYGCHHHFLVKESTSPLETIELLEDQDSGFCEWLSEPFAKQFDLVLSKAIDQKNLVILECLLKGRRWVAPSYDDKCFENARRQVDRLLDPLRNALDCADESMPTVESVNQLLDQGAIVGIFNLLPAYFREIQNEAPFIIRNLAATCYKSHSRIDLSKNIIQLARRFTIYSIQVNHSLEEDIKKIDEIIHEELKNEVRLAKDGKKWEILKSGIYQGDRFFPANTLVSARWGIIVTRESHGKSYNYLFAVKNKKGDEINFTWQATTDLEKNQGYFDNFISAAYSYLLPSIIESIDNRLNAGHSIQIGTCKVNGLGIQFETKGWGFTSTQFVPWQRVHFDVENGDLIVSDRASPKIKTAMSLRLIDNAPVLRFLVHLKTPE